MRKIIYYSLITSLLLSSCETDFQVNAEWKEIMVIYGLLDQSQDIQYIKINKAYLGDGNALQMATVADSLNYLPSDLEVKIFKLKSGSFGTYDTLGFVLLHDTIIEKESGIFSTDENIIFCTSDNDFFQNTNAEDKIYLLSVRNKKTDNRVWSQTKLIHELILDNNNLMKMGFYSTDVLNPNAIPPYEKVTTTVKWKHTINGHVYQVVGRIFYRNYYKDGTNSLDSLDWNQPTQLYDGTSEMHYTFDGDAFVHFIAENIPAMNNDINYRLLAYMEVQYAVGTEDLYTYMSLNKPFEGIVQERPTFSNIQNGIGLFSSRYNKKEFMLFTDATAKGLALEYSHLGFN